LVPIPIPDRPLILVSTEAGLVVVPTLRNSVDSLNSIVGSTPRRRRAAGMLRVFTEVALSAVVAASAVICTPASIWIDPGGRTDGGVACPGRSVAIEEGMSEPCARASSDPHERKLRERRMRASAGFIAAM
jgi:hypothetical protein